MEEGVFFYSKKMITRAGQKKKTGKDGLLF